MSLTIQPGYPKQVGSESWIFSWTSTESDPTFSVYRNGQFLTSTKRNCVTIDAAPSDIIQIFDDTETPSEGNEPTVDIHWASVPNTKKYRIDKETSPSSGTWNHVQTVEDLGQAQFKFRVDPLVDDVATSFRVVPVGTNGNDGTAASFQVTVPRHPDPPSVGYVFSDATKKVTISAA